MGELAAKGKNIDGTFTSRAYQKLAGVDMYGASRDIKDLMHKGIVRLRQKGGRVYELVSSSVGAPLSNESMEPEIKALLEARGFSRMQATWKLQRWVDAGVLCLEGRGRGARYCLATTSPLSKENA